MIGSGYNISKVTVCNPKFIKGYEQFFVVRHNGSLLGRMKTASGIGRIKPVGNNKYAHHLFNIDQADELIREHKMQQAK